MLKQKYLKGGNAVGKIIIHNFDNLNYYYCSYHYMAFIIYYIKNFPVQIRCFIWEFKTMLSIQKAL